MEENTLVPIENRYKNGKIYKLTSNLTDKVYIGSTTSKLHTRKSHHKTMAVGALKDEWYLSSSHVLYENDAIVEIQLIEYYPCASKLELELREAYWIKNTPNVVNKTIPRRTPEQWKEDNKEKWDAYMKQWREDNKDRIKEQRQNYLIETAEHVKERQEQYYEANKEHLRNKAKERYETNKQDILAKQKERVKCEICNKDLSSGALRTHMKSHHS